MSQNGDEERIRQLFHELNGQEQSLAPRFTGVLARAENRNNGSRKLALSLKFAGVAGLCLAVLLTIRLLRPVSSEEPDRDSAPPDVIASSPTDAGKTNISGTMNIERRPGARRRSRKQQFSRSLAITMKSLSSWQSPTAALLQIPQDDMLRTLPRLGESLRTIKSFSPDQFN